MKKMKKGFTLVELLVVISLIGVLASLVIISFTGSQKQGRDSQRKSDLRQYQNALEVFANKNSGLYPARPAGGGSQPAHQVLCNDLELTSCPRDPREDESAGFSYRYQSDGPPGGGTAATQYVLWGRLENEEVYWVFCSTGQSGEIPTESWINPIAGACPL